MTIARKKTQRSRLWFEKIMALIILANYLLVLFDLSYIPLRDFWLLGRVQLFFKFGQFELYLPKNPIQILPSSFSKLITKYDVFKGIEPYRGTQEYLEQVDNLEREINLKGLQNPDPELEKMFQQLRDSSVEMIQSNPFQVANKTGTLERIKNRMRDHVFNNPNSSAKEAFKTFWSREYFLKNDARLNLNFFDKQIRPLIETNYYRPVGENGEMVDNFGLIDFPFSVLFLTEFLARTWLISRRYKSLTWLDAMSWRWYDIFLFIPLFRWLRIIPLTIRLNQSELINLRAIQKQASQGFVASIAEDITQVVVVGVLNQIQLSVKEGIIRQAFKGDDSSQYIDINDTNEVVEITKLAFEVIIQEVLPKIKTDAEALLKYNLDKIISQAPVYKDIQNLPGLDNIQNQITQQLANTIYQSICDVLNSLLEEDTKFNELLGSVIESFNKVAKTELKTQRSLEKIESLMTDLLEEIKINYIEKLSEEDVESILEQTRQIRQKAANVAEIKTVSRRSLP